MPELPDSKVHAHPHKDIQTKKRASKKPTSPYRHGATSPYAELAVTSNFTFLTGASHPDEYVYQAALLGYGAIAITDRNSLAGVVRAHVAAKDAGIPFVVGCRLEINAETPKHENAETLTERQKDNEARQRGAKHTRQSGPAEKPETLSVLVYPTDRASYGRLCRLLTIGKRRASKGECFLTLDDLLAFQEGLLAILLLDAQEPTHITTLPDRQMTKLREVFHDDRLSLALTRLYGPDDAAYKQSIEALAERFRIPLVAINDVHYHIPQRRALQDVMTCVRNHCTLAEAGFRLFPNGERYLKEPQEMARLFADHPEAIARTMEIACRAAGLKKGSKATRQTRPRRERLGNQAKATEPRSHGATEPRSHEAKDWVFAGSIAV